MSSFSSEHPSLRFLARYGIPAVILLYYVSAAQKLDYTPDSTFITVNLLERSDVRSLWMALLSLSHLFSIDSLLTAKVLGLLFTSIAILFTYLIAHEVLGDHLTAFCVALTFSVQAWLLQLGPSGSGICILQLLSLAAVFFMLRNDYVVATLFAGLGTMVSWQAAGLLFVLMLDAYINSVDRNRSMNLVASIVLIFGSVILPWVLYAVYKGSAFFPDELSMSSVPTITPQMSFETVLLVGLMFIGVVVLAARDRELLRSFTAIILWTVTASFLHRLMLVLAFPLIIVFAFLAARRVVKIVAGVRHIQFAGVLLAAGILAYSQFVARPAVLSMMDNASASISEMKIIGTWLRTNTQSEETVSFPLSFAQVLQYYSERSAQEGTPSYIVSNNNDLPGHNVVFDPASSDAGLFTSSDRYKVWRRQ